MLRIQNTSTPHCKTMSGGIPFSCFSLAWAPGIFHAGSMSRSLLGMLVIPVVTKMFSVEWLQLTPTW